MDRFCECGCGKEIIIKEYILDKPNKYNIPKYIEGHHRRGMVGWNRGLTKEDNESIRNISEKNKGKHNSPKTEFKKGNISLNKNKTWEEIYGKNKAEEILKKISEKTKNAMKNPIVKEKIKRFWDSPRGKEIKEKIKIKRTGIIFSKELKLKLSISHKGKNLSDEHKNKIKENHPRLSGLFQSF